MCASQCQAALGCGGMRFKDITGLEFGRLTALRCVGNGRWLCRCECGNEKLIYGGHLRAGMTESCGCGPQVCRVTHNLSHSPEYRAWDNARERCRNPNNRKFPIYGARGISVCERWANSFDNFIADMGRKPSPSHSLDRIDNNGNYEPGNCRWATGEQQNRNRRPFKPRGTAHV